LGSPIAMQPQQGEIAETVKLAGEEATADASLAPVQVEEAKVETAAVPAPEIQNVVSDEAAAARTETNFDPVLAKLESDLAKAEARSQAMETLAYRAIAALVLLTAIFAALLLVWRARAKRAAKSGQVQESAVALATSTTQPAATQAQSTDPIKAVEESIPAEDTPPAATVAESEGQKDGPQAPASDSRACTQCNGKISVEDNFCMHCGAPAAAADTAGSTRPCWSCQKEIGAADRFCRHCGAGSLAAVAAPSMALSSDSG
jgi:hypothetical protein